MAEPQRIEENPCRPRHFRPLPPCAPVVSDERAAAALETCRSRLVATAALFAVAFVVIALRLLDIGAFAGTPTDPLHAAGRPHVAPPPPAARADILDRNGRMLATTLDSPSLYADTRLIGDPEEAARAILSVLPKLDPVELRAKLNSGKSIRLGASAA